jgi:hypothetical protein
MVAWQRVTPADVLRAITTTYELLWEKRRYPLPPQSAIY